MTNDYRAMCAELTDAELANAARKALGEPSYATELHYFLSEDSIEYEPLMLAIRAGIAADRARTLLAQPVAVSERLPGPEDCLDEGWAWFFNQRIGWRQAVLPVSPGYTHWLPANALPAPEVKP
jgi:hypothetical protein